MVLLLQNNSKLEKITAGVKAIEYCQEILYTELNETILRNNVLGRVLMGL